MKQSNSSSPSRRLVIAGLGATLTGMSLAGCSNLLPGQGPPLSLFRLSPKSTFAEGLPAVTWQLVLEAPTSNAALNTTRIALERDPMQIEYYAGAGWVDRAPTMLQTLLLESFENSDRIVSVGRENIGLRSDFVLKTDLREFQAIYGGGAAPEVLVAMTVKLVQMPQRRIVGNANFTYRSPAASDNMEAIVRAFDKALGKTLRRVVEWTLTTGQQVSS